MCAMPLAVPEKMHSGNKEFISTNITAASVSSIYIIPLTCTVTSETELMFQSSTAKFG